MEIIELKVPHNGRCSDIVFYKPDGVEKYPIIIFSHGYNGHKSDFDISAKYFAENGIGAVCHTFCGGSTRDESGFGTTNMTLFTEKEDLIAIINEVKNWEHTDKIFLFGASQGGMVSAMTAEELEDDIDGLILLFPAFYFTTANPFSSAAAHGILSSVLNPDRISADSFLFSL